MNFQKSREHREFAAISRTPAIGTGSDSFRSKHPTGRASSPIGIDLRADGAGGEPDPRG